MNIRFLRALRALLLVLGAALPWLATEARAGCGTIVTLNPTGHWVWITIYDVGQNIHMDYGWVAPHSGRKWTGGASPLPYACGSYYHVRYEVKNGKEQPQAADTGNLFDTRMQINPQLTLTDVVSLLHTLGEALTCVTPGLDAECVAQFGIKQGAEASLIGSLGSESKGSVVCLKSSDDVHFWLEAKDDCALRPATGKPPGKPPAAKYTFQPGSRSVGIGLNSRNWYFNIARDGSPIQDDATYKKGRFYTDNPGIATFPGGRHC